MVIALVFGAALVLTLKGPIGQITQAMRNLASGVLNTAVGNQNRADEIGEMARSMQQGLSECSALKFAPATLPLGAPAGLGQSQRQPEMCAYFSKYALRWCAGDFDCMPVAELVRNSCKKKQPET